MEASTLFQEKEKGKRGEGKGKRVNWAVFRGSSGSRVGFFKLLTFFIYTKGSIL
jgi:hypothetical protein